MRRIGYTSLIVADACDWTSEGHSGGAYEKVIYWAFQKQGLFNRAALDVDVYIDDGRDGDYEYQIRLHRVVLLFGTGLRPTALKAIKRQWPTSPILHTSRSRNRGSKIAKSVVVNAFQNKPQSRPDLSRRLAADGAGSASGDRPPVEFVRSDGRAFHVDARAQATTTS